MSQNHRYPREAYLDTLREETVVLTVFGVMENAGFVLRGLYLADFAQVELNSGIVRW